MGRLENMFRKQIRTKGSYEGEKAWAFALMLLGLPPVDVLYTTRGFSTPVK